MRVRILTADDDAQHHELRLRALRDHPESFLSGPEDQERLTPEERRRRLTAAEDGSKAVFGAFSDMDILLGTAGYMRGERAKARHTATLFAMYVAAEARGEGVGRAILDAMIAHLRGVRGIDRVALSVTSGATDARRLYARAGFVEWGCDRDALRIGATSYDEHHMVLVLNAPADPEPGAPGVATARDPDPAGGSVLVKRFHRAVRTDARPT